MIECRSSRTQLLLTAAELCFIEQSVIWRHVYCLSLWRRNSWVVSENSAGIKLMSLLPRWSAAIQIRLFLDTHIVTLAIDLWPWRIISPTCSAAWDIHCVVMCDCLHMYVSAVRQYMCVKKRRRKQQLLWWVKEIVSVYHLFSADKSSSMLIRALAPCPLMTSQAWGDVNTRSLMARCCQHFPPFIYQSLGHNGCSSQSSLVAQKLESWLWIYMSV